jgi:MFS family permease
MAGIGMVSPLLPVYVKDDLGGTAVAVALSFSGLSLSQLLAAPFIGRLGDRFGSKPFIVGGFFIYCVGAVGYILAPTWEWVIGFRILSGLGAAGIFPMSLAYIGRLAPPGREGTYMGAFSVAQIAGFGLGPLLGGGIRDAISSDAAFLTMALLLGATGVMTLLLLPGRPASKDGDRREEADEPHVGWLEMLRRPYVQAALAVQTVVSLGWGAGSSFLAVFVVSAEGLGTDSALFVGILLASRSLISAVLQPTA